MRVKIGNDRGTKTTWQERDPFYKAVPKRGVWF